jgi:mannosyltransferase OCH1-like enzyme
MVSTPKILIVLGIISLSATLFTFQYTTLFTFPCTTGNFRFSAGSTRDALTTSAAISSPIKLNVPYKTSSASIKELTEQILALGVKPLPKGFLSREKQSFNPTTCHIPKYFHQTWKTDQIPFSLAKYVRSWVDIGGLNNNNTSSSSWEYYFWTDKLSRYYVKKRYPTYLKMYDSLPKSIMRADLLRYFIMYDIGGIYADLDFQTLKPLDHFIQAMNRDNDDNNGKLKHSCMIGQEPLPHAHILYKVESLVCNAIMISCPGHPFWLEVIQLVEKRWKSGKYNKRVLKLTGPMVLQAAISSRRKRKEMIEKENVDDKNNNMFAPVYIAPPNVFYPNVDFYNEQLRENCNRIELKKRCKQGQYMNENNVSMYSKKALSSIACQRRKATCAIIRKDHFRNKKIYQLNSLAIHHWKHSWLPGYNVEVDYSDPLYAEWKKKCSNIDIANVIGTRFKYIKARQRCGYDQSSRSQKRYWHGSISNGRSRSGRFHEKGRSGIPVECHNDRHKFCSDVISGEGRTHQCLYNNRNQLSNECQKKIK